MLSSPTVRPRWWRDHRRRSLVFGSARANVILTLACLAVLAPCYFLTLGSFKSVDEFFASPFGLPHSWSLTNFRAAWQDADLTTAFLNSALITGVSVLISTAVACAASYAIARLRFRGASGVQIFLLAGMVLPTQLIVIATFIEMRWLGLVGTVYPMILLYSASAVPLGVLFLVGFFRTVPAALTEAAEIDGAGKWLQFVYIVLPLMRAPIFTVALLNSVWMWNDFFVPLIFANKPSLQTAPLAILNFWGTDSTNYGLIFAGVVMSALPVVIVYVLLTKRFISGVMAGSVKG